MSEATARAAVYAAVNGVSGTGSVYDYGRWSSTWDIDLKHFKNVIDGVTRYIGFMVVKNGMPSTEMEFSGGAIRTHNYNVVGFMSVDDSAATEKLFSVLVESVANAIDSNATLHDTSQFYYVPPTSTPILDARLAGSVLCHYCEINVEVQEHKTR